MNRRLLLSLILLLAACVTAGVYGVRTVWRTATERHARACLEDVVSGADHAVKELVPAGKLREALDLAEYLDGYYPAGSVLSEAHPYAQEYTQKREEQIRRILSALHKSTGMDFGKDWAAWRRALPTAHR